MSDDLTAGTSPDDYPLPADDEEISDLSTRRLERILEETDIRHARVRWRTSRELTSRRDMTLGGQPAGQRTEIDGSENPFTAVVAAMVVVLLYPVGWLFQGIDRMLAAAGVIEEADDAE